MTLETKPVLPDMRDVSGSSQIARVGHDLGKSHLFVQFWRKPTPEEQHAFETTKDPFSHAVVMDGALTKVPGSVYRYEGVAAGHHAALMNAPSKGRHFGSQIKGKFPHVKIDG